MTPIEINFSLHCYVSPTPYKAPTRTIKKLEVLGLIEAKDDYFICKDRGMAYIEMIINISLPVRMYVNPNTTLIQYRCQCLLVRVVGVILLKIHLRVVVLFVLKYQQGQSHVFQVECFSF